VTPHYIIKPALPKSPCLPPGPSVSSALPRTRKKAKNIQISAAAKALSGRASLSRFCKCLRDLLVAPEGPFESAIKRSSITISTGSLHRRSGYEHCATGFPTNDGSLPTQPVFPAFSAAIACILHRALGLGSKTPSKLFIPPNLPLGFLDLCLPLLRTMEPCRRWSVCSAARHFGAALRFSFSSRLFPNRFFDGLLGFLTGAGWNRDAAESLAAASRQRHVATRSNRPALRLCATGDKHLDPLAHISNRSRLVGELWRPPLWSRGQPCRRPGIFLYCQFDGHGDSYMPTHQCGWDIEPDYLAS